LSTSVARDLYSSFHQASAARPSALSAPGALGLATVAVLSAAVNVGWCQ